MQALLSKHIGSIMEKAELKSTMGKGKRLSYPAKRQREAGGGESCQHDNKLGGGAGRDGGRDQNTRASTGEIWAVSIKWTGKAKKRKVRKAQGRIIRVVGTYIDGGHSQSNRRQ